MLKVRPVESHGLQVCIIENATSQAVNLRDLYEERIGVEEKGKKSNWSIFWMGIQGQKASRESVLKVEKRHSS